MTKLMVMVSSKEIINQLNCDSILLGIKGLSINMPFYFNYEEIKEICDNTNKEVFISINKNIHNSDLSYLNEILLKLNNLKVKGVFFYDMAVLNLKKKLNLNCDLVWAQEHMTTNSYTADFYFKKGVKYVSLSAEITKEEIIDIRKQVDLQLIVPIFGYIPMFTSFRHEAKNYLSNFKIKNDNQLFYISKEGNDYSLVDNEEGTTIYTSFILNGIREYLELKDANIDYVLLNNFNINDDQFIKVIEIFNSVNTTNVNNYNQIINEMFKTDTGFLNKETIYRVKKDE